MNALRWLMARVAMIPSRDSYFWGGLLLLGLGVAREWSPGLASTTVGVVLLFVAIFGIAPSRAS